MIRYICTVCGYVEEGDTAPDYCPQCKAPESKFKLMDQESYSLADEHRIGVVEGIDPEIIEALRNDFRDECTEIGMYIAMSRQADREGFPEIADALKRIALEEADHASKYAELLGEVLFADTKRNLELRAEAEFSDCDQKKKIATRAKQLNLDAIHDTVHEMCKDEGRHYRILKGLRDRYFN